MKIGLVGLGRWGSVWARVLQEEEVLGWVTDKDSSKKGEFSDHWLPVLATEENLNVDGVIIATPPSTHFSLTRYFLNREIPVLCEKPLTLDPREAAELVQLSKNKLTPLLAGHTFLYSEPIRVAADYLNMIGKIKKINCRWLQNGTRSNLGLNALWNLGPHPFSIVGALLEGKKPENIKTVIDGDSYHCEFICGEIEVYIVLSHENASPVREIIIMGEEGDVTCRPNAGLVTVTGDDKRYEIDVRGREPLKKELDFFIEVIRDYADKGYFYGQKGLWVVDLLHRIEPYE